MVRPSSDPLLDPWTLQAIGTALGALCFVIALVRWVLPGQRAVGRWSGRDFAFDRVLSLLLAAGFASLVVSGVGPWVGAGALLHHHSHGSGDLVDPCRRRRSMAFIGATSVHIRTRPSRPISAGRLSGSADAPGRCQPALGREMVGSRHSRRFGGTVALAGLLLIGSVPVWFRDRLPGDSNRSQRNRGCCWRCGRRCRLSRPRCTTSV